MRKNNKGFTLAEMLIVVAIIGILIAIVTITISNSLEKAREATDLANIRSAISEVAVYAMTDDRTNKPAYITYNSKQKHYCTYIKPTQRQQGWQSKNIKIDSKGYALLNGAKVNTGDFSKNNRAYKIMVNVDGTITVNLITTNRIESVGADDMYYHTNEYVKTY